MEPAEFRGNVFQRAWSLFTFGVWTLQLFGVVAVCLVKSIPVLLAQRSAKKP